MCHIVILIVIGFLNKHINMACMKIKLSCLKYNDHMGLYNVYHTYNIVYYFKQLYYATRTVAKA